jgi:hypothetical protein
LPGNSGEQRAGCGFAIIRGRRGVSQNASTNVSTMQKSRREIEELTA